MAAILLGVLLTFDRHSALAASGGRMGGRSFSSSSSSYSSPSRSSSYSWSSRSSSYSSLSSSSSSSSSWFSSEPVRSSPGSSCWVRPSLGHVAMSGFVLVMLVSALMILGASCSEDGGVLTATQKTSVLKLQVGLLGSARSLQSDLNWIASYADTSTKAGLNYVLKETVLSLLRHPGYCISAYSSTDVNHSMMDGEKRFDQLSIEERGNFDEETLVNVDNIKKQSTLSLRSKGFSNEYIVVTVLVAAEGVLKLPVINGPSDLKEALQKLGSVPSSGTLAVEVLWTPQLENDTLSERELLEDYPLLRPLLG